MANPFIPPGFQNASGVIVAPEPTPPLTAAQEADAEIIQVLDGTGNCPGCIGGLTQAELLTRLQSQFPAMNWDDTILQARLRAGLREGRFCRTGASRYAMRQDMVIVNNANSVFIPFSNNITVPPGMLTTQASVDFVFNGNAQCSKTLTNVYNATAVSIIESQLVASTFLTHDLISD